MTKVDQITLRELLRDPIYKKWFQTVPKLPAEVAHTPPWRIYIQREQFGSWARLELQGYVKAYRWTAKHLKEYHDIVIVAKRCEFKPPVVKTKEGKRVYWPVPAGHRWCTYCRRPTVFAYFSKHHLFSGKPGYNGGIAWAKRCMVCGIRAVSVKEYHSPLESKLRGLDPADEETLTWNS